MLDVVLKACVRDRLVDYAAVVAKKNELDAFLAQVAAADTKPLSDDDKLAFFINAYNALVLRSFLTDGLHSSGKRVIDVKGFFDADKHYVAKEALTLNELEEKKIRLLDATGVSRDPRIHFAVNCASKDCPPLAPVPYAGKTVRGQLDAQTRAYLTRAGEVRFDETARTIVVVQLFEWYAADFGGERGVRIFLSRYVADKRIADEAWELDHRPYDWTPNAIAAKEAKK